MLIEQTTLPAAALPLDRFKAHLRLGTGFSDGGAEDALLEAFLRAAIATIEERTSKVLSARSFTWGVHGWRDGERETLPVAPVSRITELRVHDRRGTVCVCDPGTYRLERDGTYPRIVAGRTHLPTIPQGGGAEVDFEAGFGEDWDSVPPDLGQAVFLLAAHYHENRHEAASGAGHMPFGVAALIGRWRRLRMTAGGAS
ncbi:hypothetical protein GCM10008966_03580 [Rhodovulum strictum]